MPGLTALRRSRHRLALLHCAWRLHGVAQRLGNDESLPATQRALLAHRAVPAEISAEDALWAATWVARVRRRLFGELDTCLLRSLVAGALAAGAPGVEVRIGVQRPRPGADLLDAHAWLTVADREIPVAPSGSAERFEEVLVLPMERG